MKTPLYVKNGSTILVSRDRLKIGTRSKPLNTVSYIVCQGKVEIPFRTLQRCFFEGIPIRFYSYHFAPLGEFVPCKKGVLPCSTPFELLRHLSVDAVKGLCFVHGKEFASGLVDDVFDHVCKRCPKDVRFEKKGVVVTLCNESQQGIVEHFDKRMFFPVFCEIRQRQVAFWEWLEVQIVKNQESKLKLADFSILKESKWTKMEY